MFKFIDLIKNWKGSDKVILVVDKGSLSEKYAIDNNIKYKDPNEIHLFGGNIP